MARSGNVGGGVWRSAGPPHPVQDAADTEDTADTERRSATPGRSTLLGPGSGRGTEARWARAAREDLAGAGRGSEENGTGGARMRAECGRGGAGVPAGRRLVHIQ